MTPAIAFATPARRLQDLRERAGYRSAAEAARAVGANIVTFQHHENGRRPISRHAAHTYGRFFNVPGGYILYGERLHDNPLVPIVGFIGPAGAIQQTAPEAELQFVPAPNSQTRNLVAITVIARDLWPGYSVGDTAFYSRKTLDADIDKAAVDGRECVIARDDGSLDLRYVTVNGNGRATLLAYSGKPEVDVIVRHAAPILWVQKRP
jgi:DNA-binding XRE family transcriptional regulator